MTPDREPVDPEYTNLAAAMKLAQATFPEDAAKRIVLVSDGNQNLGNALEQGQGLAAAGVGIDVVPIRYHNLAEVAVERVVLPSDVRRSQPFDLRVVVNNLSRAAAGRPAAWSTANWSSTNPRPRSTRLLSEQHITLPPGKKVFTVRQQIDAPNFYTYEARFIPDRPEDDTMPQNNRATAFTQVQGKGQVLLIEDCEHKGRARPAGRALAAAGLASDGPRQRPGVSSVGRFAALRRGGAGQRARATNENVNFTDEQIDMLVRNTQQIGRGAGDAGRAQQFRRRRLDRHRIGKGHAGRFPDPATPRSCPAGPW